MANHCYLQLLLFPSRLNMAAFGLNKYCYLEQFSYNQVYHGVCKCVNCVRLESQLKETLREMNSPQFIIKLLLRVKPGYCTTQACT
jgi:hypothetical protein